jgi:beta-N-acetylhexosaminidase
MLKRKMLPELARISGIYLHTDEHAGKRQLTLVSRLFLVCCCLAILLVGCDNSFAAPSSTTDVATSQAATSKSAEDQIELTQRNYLMKAQNMLKNMTLDQKIGQLIMVEYESSADGYAYQDTALPAMISQNFVGGYLYQSANHNYTPPQDTVSGLNAFSQLAMKDAKIPLLIAVDQEGGGGPDGGGVNKIENFFGPTKNAQDMAATGDTKVASDAGAQSAQWMKQLGINVDLAPDADVQSIDPAPDWLATRMFAHDPQTVANYAGAFLDGLQKNGIIGTLKHFPGLGNVVDNPHDVLPVNNRSKADLEKIDFAPYKALIQQKHPAMIMSTDVLLPAIDANLPAELSSNVITGVLRQELGYDGVIITDGIYMKGLYPNYVLTDTAMAQIAVKAIQAGNDMVEGPYTSDQIGLVVNAFEDAVSQGTLTETRIDQSVQRLLAMKMQYGIIK